MIWSSLSGWVETISITARTLPFGNSRLARDQFAQSWLVGKLGGHSVPQAIPAPSDTPCQPRCPGAFPIGDFDTTLKYAEGDSCTLIGCQISASQLVLFDPDAGFIAARKPLLLNANRDAQALADVETVVPIDEDASPGQQGVAQALRFQTGFQQVPFIGSERGNQGSEFGIDVNSTACGTLQSGHTRIMPVDSACGGWNVNETLR